MSVQPLEQFLKKIPKNTNFLETSAFLDKQFCENLRACIFFCFMLMPIFFFFLHFRIGKIQLVFAKNS